MNKLSVTIITKNEESNIAACIKSVRWADEIVVVDSGSTDRTVEICKELGCRVIISEWLGFGKTKKLAVDNANHDWIFSIDADEVVTDVLKDQILSILKQPDCSGYKIKRKSFYLGKMINRCGWDKDFPLRLFDRRTGNFNDKIVHESIVIKGEKGKIKEHMFHYTYPTLDSHLQKINSYSLLGAKQLFKKGKRSSIMKAIIRGKFKFFKMYLLQRGFLDGKEGFVLSLNSAYGVFLKYLKLWELDKGNS